MSTEKDLGAFGWFKDGLSKYVRFSGRTQRRGFWYFQLFAALFGIVANVLDVILLSTLGFAFVGILFWIAMILPNIALSVRRLHDIGKSGWFFLVYLIPLAGFIMWIIWNVTESQTEDNQFGPYKP